MKWCIVLCIWLTGCAARKPSLPAYRVLRVDNRNLLIPPGVTGPDVAVRTMEVPVATGKGNCVASESVAISKKKKRIRVTVSRDALLRQPQGWLSEWTSELESQDCIGRGEAPKLAEQLAAALPLETTQAFHLLHSTQLDIVPQMTIQVVSPIVREGTPPEAPLVESVEAAGNGLTLTVRASKNLLGVEMASYAVRAEAGGLKVVALFAERHIDNAVERRPEPETNYFLFGSEASFYRVFYEAQQTDYAALIIAARTRAELEQSTRTLETGPATCERLRAGSCVGVPKQVAINGLIPVTVNGSPIQVIWGSNVGAVLRAAGQQNANGLLSTLSVKKQYRGALVAVDFDPSSGAIFDLIVTGGEEISWQR